jgi:hypothetical protein
MISCIKKHFLAMVLFGAFVASAQAQLVPNAAPLVLSVPGTYNYANSFNNVATSTFQDLFEFTITPANFSTAATTISLDSTFGISNLRATLFSGIGTGGTNLLGTWSNPIQTSPISEVTLFSLNSLATGTYTLAVKGNFFNTLTNSATTGGSYAGVLNLTNAAPVPEPSQGLAILAGLGLLGFQLRKNMKDDS